MSSLKPEPLTAEGRFRLAFERLKANNPTVLPHNTEVTQNNVAREAERDPSALKKERFPVLVGEIQAYVLLHEDEDKAKREKALKKKRANRTLAEQLSDTIQQRDAAQSMLTSATERIVELSEQVHLLQIGLDEARSNMSRK